MEPDFQLLDISMPIHMSRSIKILYIIADLVFAYILAGKLTYHPPNGVQSLEVKQL
jgi:hypothetical protein